MSVSSSASIATGLTPGDFNSPTVEKLQGPFTGTGSYDFGNGMTYLNLNGQSDYINYTGGYGMGTEPYISSGKDGPGDGYFGTGPTPTTFELAFPGGIFQFGFYGAESSVPNGSAGRNAELDLELYDLSDELIGTATLSTAGTFAWDQFHGLSSDAPIGRVVFRDVGHMVLDDVHFSTCGNGTVEPSEDCDDGAATNGTATSCCSASCAFVAPDESCDDGDECTQIDTCDGAGVCVGDDPVVCNASDQCHDVGTCDPATGVCDDPAKADGTVCDDTDACTLVDTCQAGTCDPGESTLLNPLADPDQTLECVVQTVGSLP